MGNSDDAAFGIIIVVGLILCGLWVLFLFIIEYFVLFLIGGLIAWALYYYISNAEEWERQAQRKTEFGVNNRKNHVEFKSFYNRASSNIKTLQSSFLGRDYRSLFASWQTSLDVFNSYVHLSPESFFKEKMPVTTNPYEKPLISVSKLIDRTTSLPFILEKFRKQYNNLSEKNINQASIESIYSELKFSNILGNLILNGPIILNKQFEISNSGLLHYIPGGEIATDTDGQKASASASEVGSSQAVYELYSGSK